MVGDDCLVKYQAYSFEEDLSRKENYTIYLERTLSS